MAAEESPLNSVKPDFGNIRPSLYYLIPAILLLAFILLRNLWISDDAFITLRTIDNFLQGYGLVWNVGERVQVYTNPLWLFILLPFCLFTPDRMYVLYAISFLLSLGAIFLMLWNFSARVRHMVIAVILLGGSMAFVDYSSSGLENPLTHLLLVSFFILYLHKDRYSSKWRLLQLSLIAALTALNRLDTILLFIPALLYELFSNREWRWKNLMLVAAGFMPLLLWEIFATFYYGFPFPNTFYAKAATGLDKMYMFDQGWAYIQNSLRWDPLTMGVIIFGILSAVFQREGRRISIALGILLYLFYILWIGGDFMSGRFFSGIFLMGLILLLTFNTGQFLGSIPHKLFSLLVVSLLLVGLSAEWPPLFRYPSQPGRTEHGIASEKFYYFSTNGWINYARSGELHYLAGQGMQASQSGVSPVIMNTIGMYGYHAGPRIYIVDSYALSDPLRAHLPVEGPSRVGHYERVMPSGYWETIQSGFSKNLIEDVDLNLYYEKLSVLIRGDLFARGRMQEIFRFNTGYYDPLIKKYWERLHSAGN
jgi:arabinofuranosyltransferase